MPRILRLINRLNLGGPTLNVAYLTKYLSPGFDTLLVAGMIDESEASSEFVLKEMGLHPVYIPEMYREINPVKDSRAYFQLKKLIRDFKPDIVHTHAAKAGALGRMAADACNVPVILHTFHGHVFHSYFPKWKTDIFIRIERMLANRSSSIIAISEKQKRELSEEYRITSADKIEVIPLGFDLSRFTENRESKRKKFRQSYLVDDDEIVVTIVGRLVPVKNHRLFLYALKNILQRTSQKIRAFIVGDGEERRNLALLAGELDIPFTDFTAEKKVVPLTFTSWIREVDEVYAGSDVVALTSLNEGTPVSIIEALASGKPVVTTDAGGIRDIVTHEKNGLIVSRDPEVFASALLHLIENRNTFSPVDEKAILNRFSYQRLIHDMQKLYDRLLSA